MLNAQQEIVEKSESVIRDIDDTISKVNMRINRAQKTINSELTKMARKFFLNNYARSGLKTRTGKLRNALASVNVIVTLSDDPRIQILMPPGVSSYDGGSDFYKVASALNYGAVHGNVSDNKKSNIKKKDSTHATKAYKFWDLTDQQIKLMKEKALEIFNLEVYGNK